MVVTKRDNSDGQSSRIIYGNFRNQTASVSDWVRHLKDGDAEAAQQLWNRYFQKLSHTRGNVFVHTTVPKNRCSEDVAASVFESLWKEPMLAGFRR